MTGAMNIDEGCLRAVIGYAASGYKFGRIALEELRGEFQIEMFGRDGSTLIDWLDLGKLARPEDIVYPPDEMVAGLVRAMEPEDRLSLFRQFCPDCGTANPSCQCGNDE